MYMKKIFPLFFMFLFLWKAQGQVHEFGFWAGGNNIISDIGRESLVMPDGYAVSGYYRWNINPWYALRLQGGFSSWSVADERAQSSGRRLRNWESGGSLVDGKILMEYEFLPLNPYKRPLRVLVTPYVTAGAGIYYTNAHSGEISVGKLTADLPFGMGIKFSLSRRIKFSVEILAHYGFGDDLEASYSRDTGSMPVTNRWSRDWYITQTAGFSIGFGQLPCYLNVF